MRLLPRGYKTVASYHSYILRWEKAMYKEYEAQSYFDIVLTSPMRQDGLVYQYYEGSYTNEYGSPIFTLKDDRCTTENDTSDWECHRCNEREDMPWWHVDDDVMRVPSYPVYDKYGKKRERQIRFDQEFAARRSHP